MKYFNDVPKAQLEATYRKLAMLYHPDRGGETHEFIAMKKEYEILRRGDYSNAAPLHKPAVSRVVVTPYDCDQVRTYVIGKSEWNVRFTGTKNVNLRSKNDELLGVLIPEFKAGELICRHTFEKGWDKKTLVLLPLYCKNGKPFGTQMMPVVDVKKHEDDPRHTLGFHYSKIKLANYVPWVWSIDGIIIEFTFPKEETRLFHRAIDWVNKFVLQLIQQTKELK